MKKAGNIVTGHPSGGYALVGASVLAGIVTTALVLAAVVRGFGGQTLVIRSK